MGEWNDHEYGLDGLTTPRAVDPWWRDPKFWIAVVLIGFTFFALTIWVTRPAQAQEEDPERVLCLEPEDAHALVGQSLALRSSLVACQGELQAIEDLPECSTACQSLGDLMEAADERHPRAYRLPDGTADLCDGEEGDPPREDCRWRFWPTHTWERAERLREQCRQDIQGGCRFIPGLPSTGRVELELVPGDGGGHE